MSQRVVFGLYSRKAKATHVNNARKELFCRHGIPMSKLPPTQDSLTQHIRRCFFVAGLVWGQSLEVHQNLPQTSDWGWITSKSGLEIKWGTKKDVATASHQLVRCACKKACLGRCGCSKANLECTTLCSCVCSRD